MDIVLEQFELIERSVQFYVDVKRIRCKIILTISFLIFRILERCRINRRFKHETKSPPLNPAHDIREEYPRLAAFHRRSL